MTITVSSTTDSEESVRQAINYGLKTAPATQTAEEPAEHPEADEAETGADQEPAQKRESEPEPDEPEEEEPEEEHDEEEEEPEQQARPVGKTRRKLLRRLSRLHGENLTLQERLEEAEQRIRRMEGGEKPAADAAPMGKPNPKDYKDYEAYVEALADYKIAQRDQQKAKEAQDEYAKQVIEEYNQQVKDARETHDDFDEVVGQSAQVPIIAINAMYELENGAEVAYYLGKHPEVRAELLEWNTPGTKGGVGKIFATINRISEQLQNHSSRSNGNATAPARPQPRTSAPAPIKPVGSSASSRSTADPGNMSYQDYKRWYAKKYGPR